MKKIIILLALAMVVLAGCNSENGANNKGQVDTGINNNEKDMTNGEENPNNEDDNKDETDKDNSQEVNDNNDEVSQFNGEDLIDYKSFHPSVTIKYPAGYRESQRGTATIFQTVIEYSVSFISDFDGQYKGALEDVPELFKEKYPYYVAGHSDSWLYNVVYEVKNKEKVTASGMDSIKFDAVVKVDEGDSISYECCIYGYAFVIDGYATAVIGIVSSEEQDPAMIDEMKRLTDVMADTIKKIEE